MPEFLLADKTGMTTVVYSEKDRDQYIQKGYKLIVDTSIVNNQSTLKSDVININSFTVKELVDSLETTRSLAKKLIDNRPYESTEQLVAIAPEISCKLPTCQVS